MKPVFLRSCIKCVRKWEQKLAGDVESKRRAMEELAQRRAREEDEVAQVKALRRRLFAVALMDHRLSRRVRVRAPVQESKRRALVEDRELEEERAVLGQFQVAPVTLRHV